MIKQNRWINITPANGGNYVFAVQNGILSLNKMISEINHAEKIFFSRFILYRLCSSSE